MIFLWRSYGIVEGPIDASSSQQGKSTRIRLRCEESIFWVAYIRWHTRPHMMCGWGRLEWYRIWVTWDQYWWENWEKKNNNAMRILNECTVSQVTHFAALRVLISRYIFSIILQLYHHQVCKIYGLEYIYWLILRLFISIHYLDKWAVCEIWVVSQEPHD